MNTNTINNNSNSNNKKLYYHGRSKARPYAGKYIFITDSIGYASGYSDGKTLYVYSLPFGEEKLFSIKNPLHLRLLHKYIDDYTIKQIFLSSGDNEEIDWAALSFIGTDEFQEPEDLFEHLGFYGIRLKERTGIESIYVFDQKNLTYEGTIDLSNPEIQDKVIQFYKDFTKDKNFVETVVKEEVQNLFEIGNNNKSNYSKFPLTALVRQAKNFKDFKDFEHFYTISIFHGYYWHWTNNPNFTISDSIAPRDMSSMGDNSGGNKGAIMLTSDMNYWDAHYNQHEKGKIVRPYAVLFDASYIDPRYLKQVSRGFGNEIYLYPEQVKQLRQIGVYKRDNAKALERRMHAMIPKSSDELYKLWKSVNISQ